MRIGRVGAVLAAAAVAGASLTACGGSPSAAGQLTLYSGQHVQTTEALVTAFEQKTGIAVQVRSGDEDVLADQIVTEGSNSPADVLFTENSPPLQHLQGKGLLSPVDRSTLARTPAKFDSPRGDWVGVSARVSVLVYNTALLKPSELPTSVMQLADPKWKGKLAIAPAETDFQPIVTSVARTYGDAAALKWLEGLKANAGSSHIYPDNETVTDEVNKGKAAIGIIDQYYWYRQRAQVGAAGTHSDIAYFAPHDAGYVLDVSGAGIMKSSDHKAEGQKFLAFLTSKAAQEIIARGDSFEYPIASGVTTAQAETPFDQLQPNAISVADLGDGSEAVRLLTQVQLI
ncbi:MAG TPA: extracellular solute-binding protein [Acidimicrobiales bacterium]|nr:extracellular solute-binding protein [Acidimicrobiales bacterium]